MVTLEKTTYEALDNSLESLMRDLNETQIPLDQKIAIKARILNYHFEIIHILERLKK